MNAHATPGWYPNPSGMPGNLFWDGSQWHTGIPAAPKPKSLPKRLLWIALAGFLVMKAGMTVDPGPDTRLGALITVVGLFVFAGGLFSAAVATITNEFRRRGGHTRGEMHSSSHAPATASPLTR
jgi:hypothetical protein